MSDFFKAVGQGIGKIAQQAEKTAKDVGEGVANAGKQFVETLEDVAEGTANAVGEADKAAGEFVRNTTDGFTKEMDDIGKAAKKGDFFGAYFEAAELLSPGTHVANTLAALGVGKDDPLVSNLISAAANLVGGGSLSAIAKDIADVAAELAKSPISGSGKPAPAHTPPPPTAFAGTQNLAKLEQQIAAIFERLGGTAPGAARNCGWAGRLPKPNELPKRVRDQLDDLRRKPGGMRHPLPVRIREPIERLPHAPDSEVAKLPRPCAFEDLVAAFMIDVMKAAQEDVKAKMEELERMNDQKQMLNNMKQAADGAKMGAEVVGTVIGTVISPGIGTAIGNGVGKMAGEAMTGGEALTHKKEELEDSRQLLFEQMKNSMNRLQQMQQALSNVLNTMHQGAMNSIRNIK